ncbi:MAG: NAD(P)H-dependent oxidoreductase [Desulfomonilia bacterium]|nr:NAD(P)H-dependent oxidoreductase [Desulfomonilia bacterium]
MKVLALNSSPRIQGQSKTLLMLEHLVKGMEKAGAEVELVHLRKKKIKNCIGCFTCWTKTPGTCIHKDDMTRELYPKFIGSDIVVMATPLYHFTMNAVMKSFIERTLPVIQPYLMSKDGVTYHPLRDRHPGVVILSVAGFPEMSVFDQLSNHLRFMYNVGLFAEIYRPAAETMTQPVFKEICDDILDGVSQAGIELVKTLKVTPETMERITQPICDSEVFGQMGNLFWDACISHGMTPEEAKTAGIIPRPTTIEEFLRLMQMAFNSRSAEKQDTSIQFVFSGCQEGVCHFLIRDGTIESALGETRKPDLVIDAPFDVWMDVVTGKADGAKLFHEGRYRARGDMDLLTRMEAFFGSRERENPR